MKKILYLTFCIITFYSNAQVFMGSGPAVTGTSILLNFEGHTATDATNDAITANNRGIILPSVGTTPTFSIVTPATNNSNNGTFIFDKSTKMIKMFENGNWRNFSTTAGDDSKVLANTSAEVGTGVIIGANTTTAKGVLVLESSSKSLVLPHIQNPHLTVKSPYPGMMCYDTASNTIAIFDGTSWNYWR